MTGEQLDTILKAGNAKKDEGGWLVLPEGGTMTLHVAYNGASLTVPRVEAVRAEGSLLFARTPRRELFAVAREDIFAVALDGPGGGQNSRRPGFG